MSEKVKQTFERDMAFLYLCPCLFQNRIHLFFFRLFSHSLLSWPTNANRVHVLVCHNMGVEHGDHLEVRCEVDLDILEEAHGEEDSLFLACTSLRLCLVPRGHIAKEALEGMTHERCKDLAAQRMSLLVALCHLDNVNVAVGSDRRVVRGREGMHALVAVE